MPMLLQGKKVLLGVCGGIAAYKSAVLVRLLIKEGAEVRVVMTPSAHEFVGPVTFATLSKYPVATEFSNTSDGKWNNHVEYGLWADVMLVAPATANTLAKLAHGLCDNFLLATLLSARCPVMLAPAMDLDMWQHPATRRNMELLRADGHYIIAPASGELASGLSGTGRMQEPDVLLSQLIDILQGNSKRLAGKKVLITAGPTYEAIDPVRFIGNHSSGKMGFALAEVCASEGAEVTLVHGPVHLHSANAAISTIAVQSAAEMFAAADKAFTDTDIFIAAAAVADFTPVTPATQKIKKNLGNEEGLHIALKRTTDILGTLAAKKSKQFIVGFALETENGLEHARNKMAAKQLDLCVLNLSTEAGAGFGHDTNRITLLQKNGEVVNFDLKSKTAVARDIVQHIIQHLHA